MPEKVRQRLCQVISSIAVALAITKLLSKVRVRKAGEHSHAQENQPEGLWEALNRATTWALQGEVTVQQRYYNFLVADSVLFLSWSTLYAGRGLRAWPLTSVLIVLASLSAGFAAAWTLGGFRWRRYIALQWDLATDLERLLPEPFRYGTKVDELRQQRSVTGPSGREYRIRRLERGITVNRLLVWTPMAFCAVSGLLIVASAVTA
jgi:NADH:ubiquinone oxidoreductase subunit 3 (subunit A)